MPTMSPLHRTHLVQLVEHTVSDLPLRRMLSVIEKEIASSVSQIHDTSCLEDDMGLYDAVNEYEGDHIEQLLGLAFVSAQIFITTITSGLKRLSDKWEQWEQNVGRPLIHVDIPKGSTYRKELMKLANPILNETNYHEIEVINAIADCWKHQEEWPTCKEPQEGYIVWDEKKMKGTQKTTHEIVTSINMSWHSNGADL